MLSPNPFVVATQPIDINGTKHTCSSYQWATKELQVRVRGYVYAGHYPIIYVPYLSVRVEAQVNHEESYNPETECADEM